MPDIPGITGNNRKVPKWKFNVRNDGNFQFLKGLKRKFQIRSGAATVAGTKRTAEIGSVAFVVM